MSTGRQPDRNLGTPANYNISQEDAVPASPAQEPRDQRMTMLLGAAASRQDGDR